MNEQEEAAFLESFEHTGIYIVDRETMHVLYENSTAMKYTKLDRLGKPCYQVHGNKSMCASCPLRTKERKTLVNREDLGMIFSVTARETVWQGRKTYTIFVEKERDIPKRKSLSEESLERMNRALHSSIISYVDINMATEKCQAIHFAEDGNHQIYNMEYDRYMREICFNQYVFPEDKLHGETTVGIARLRELSEDSEGASETSIRFRIRGKNGQERVLESTAYILRDELPHHVSIVAKDVTQEERNRSQLFLYNKLVSSSVTTFRLNLTKNTFQNLVGAELYTESVNAQLGECSTLDEFYTFVIKYTMNEENIEKSRSFFDRKKQLRLFAEGKSIIRERLPIDMDDGSYMWMDITCTMLQNDVTGDVEAIMYSEAVDENVISENVINQMISNDYDYLALFDLFNHTNKVFTNSARYQKTEMEKNLGQENREAYLRKIYAGDDLETFLYHNSISYIRKRLEEQRQFDNYYYVREKDGRITYKKETLSYLNGDDRFLLLSRTDNTDAVENQEAVNQKLRVALDQAQKAREEREELFTRMSHDMRTPMNGILGMTALSMDEPKTEILQMNMRQIDASAKYMLRMINDTLDMKRIETGDLILNPDITKCSRFIENLIDMIRPNMSDAGLHFQMENKNIDLERYALFDPVRMEQIFINLVSNAIKYTPKGGTVKFYMECLSSENGVDHDMFEIRDSGIGMSRNFLKYHLFTPYAQENNDLTGKYAGPGLGLAITKSLVDLMGGRIEADSEMGKGTTFRIYLDITMVDLEEAEKSSEKDRKQLAMQHLDGKRILLCEDHPLNAEISRKLLEQAGCTVTWAQDGAQGVEAFVESRMDYFDAILMDIRMPRMDGIQATKKIRSLPREDAKSVPILAMTANAFEKDKEETREAGMNDHLAKPVVPGVLYEALDKAIR